MQAVPQASFPPLFSLTLLSVKYNSFSFQLQPVANITVHKHSTVAVTSRQISAAATSPYITQVH